MSQRRADHLCPLHISNLRGTSVPVHQLSSRQERSPKQAWSPSGRPWLAGLLTPLLVACPALCAVPQPPSAIREWCDAWRDITCAKLLWDLEIPSYDAASGGWKPGRVLGGYAAKWPGGYVIDLSDSIIRDRFFPHDVAKSDSLARIRATTQRTVRQPDGMSLQVTINTAIKGGMFTGQQPSLAERPDPLVGANPPVIAWWLSSRLDDPSAIGIVRSEADAVEFEALELKAVVQLRKDDKSQSWYLARLARIGADGRTWWSAEFKEPQSFGTARHTLGTTRIVEVETSERVTGGTTVPASPRTRTDFLLDAILETSCPDKDFTQDLHGLTLSSGSAPTNPQAEQESNKRMQAAFAKQASRPSETATDPNESSSSVWWISGIAGVACVALGAGLAFRKRSSAA